MKKISSTGIAVGLLLAAVGLAACGDSGGSGGGSSGSDTTASSSQLPQGSEPVNLDPADFTTTIDNSYWPMSPGDRWVYRETDGKGGVQHVVVTVTDQTKQIANGVTARVVHDVVSEDGQPVEVTDDYYAQDSSGTIWYLGENTAEYENGVVSSREGSFESGVDGAQPGVILPGDPQVGQSYRQEYKAGEAEDQGKILSLGEQVTVPFGHFTDALLTEDSNPLDKSVEHKLYAKGVGPVKTIDVGTQGRELLLSYTKGS